MKFPDHGSIEQHLLREFVPAVFTRTRTFAYRDRKLGSRAGEAARWLGFLASRTRHGGQIAFWSLSRLAPMRRLGLAAAVVFGVLIGLCERTFPAFAVGLELCVTLGLFFGFGFGRGYSLVRAGGPYDPARTGYGGRVEGTDTDLSAHLTKLVYGVVMIAVSLVTAAFSYSLPRVDLGIPGSVEQRRGLIDWSIVSILLATLAALVGGAIAARILQNSPRFESHVGARAKTPAQAVHNDRTSGLGMVALSWLFNGLLCAGVLLVGTDRGASTDLFVGLLAALVAPIAANLLFNAWFPYKIAHVWLTFRGMLPWGLTDFLDEAHRNGALRQNGISYEFRHERLRESLGAAFLARSRPSAKLSATSNATSVDG